MIIPTLLVVRKIQNLMWLKKISSIFFRFFWNLAKSVSKLWNSSKKSHGLNLALCGLKLNQNGPLHKWIGLIQYGVVQKSGFLVTFFLTQIFSISEYCKNLAPSQILEGYYGKLENVMPIFFTTHEVPISLDRLSQKNTK